MNNELYQHGKIYKIWSPTMPDKAYIGSTCTTLPKRLYGHRKSLKQWKRGKSNYVTSYDILECPDHDIELIEAYPCKNKMELHRREGQHIRETECVNRCIAGRTRAEWYVNNAEKCREQKKLYKRDNAEKLKQRYICPCGGRYTHANKLQHSKTKKHLRHEAAINLTGNNDS